MIQRYATRPRPLYSAASRLSKILGTIGALTTALVGWGVVTVAQGDAVDGLLGTIPGVVTAVFTVLSAFGVVRAGEPQVTPVESPRNDAMEPLFPR